MAMRSMNQVKEKEKLHSQTTIIIPKGKVDKFSAQNTTQAVQLMVMIFSSSQSPLVFQSYHMSPKIPMVFPKR